MSPRYTDTGLDDTQKAWMHQCDKSNTPLISWQEVQIMHDTGIVDIQCHMDEHLRVPVKPRIETFVSPRMIGRYYFKFEIPAMRGVSPGKEECCKLLGAPVYTSSPAQMDRPMYVEDTGLRRACVSYVAENGAEAFFNNTSWRKKLRRAAGPQEGMNRSGICGKDLTRVGLRFR